MPADLRPCATMSGISGWSAGYQSARLKGSLASFLVKAKVLPGRCCREFSLAVFPPDEFSDAGLSASAGPVPYAHSGGLAFDSATGLGSAPLTLASSARKKKLHSATGIKSRIANTSMVHHLQIRRGTDANLCKSFIDH